MPESPIRTHLRLVRAGATAEAPWGRLRKVVPDSAIVPIGRREPGAADADGSPDAPREIQLAREIPLPREAPASRQGSRLRRHLSVIAGGLSGTGWGRTRTLVPRRAIVLVGRAEAGAARPWAMPRRHALMLALALEILCVGALYATNPPRRGITVEEPLTTGNVVTEAPSVAPARNPVL